MFCYEIIDEPSLSLRATPQLMTPTSQLVRPVAQSVQVLNATWTSRSQIKKKLPQELSSKTLIRLYEGQGGKDSII